MRSRSVALLIFIVLPLTLNAQDLNEELWAAARLGF